MSSRRLNRVLRELARRLAANGLDVNICYSLDKPVLDAMFELTNPLNSQKCESWTKADELTYEGWSNGMRMIVRVEGGVPDMFRQRVWLILANRNIQKRKVDWLAVCKKCFSETLNPDDLALDSQIVKDLHRTGCSKFSKDELHNQILLKQVLLAYARFNKIVGYCQGFNMLAAIILEVMDGDVENSFKVMIMLIEDVLPESYFANNLRGLSVDMAVFRDILRMKLPELSDHLDRLQSQSFDQAYGVVYEPPLVNVFTMQWFLTIFVNCLPKEAIIRIWDLMFMEGNEVLIRTALAIWDHLADRIVCVATADDFYSIMGVLSREIMEFGMDGTANLIMIICEMEPFPFPHLDELRERYIYNIRPLSLNMGVLKKGLVSMFSSSVQKFLLDSDDEADGAPGPSGSSGNGRDPRQPPQTFLDDQFVVAAWNANSEPGNRKTSPSRNGASNPTSPSNGGGNFLENFVRQIQVSFSSNSNELKVPGDGKSGNLITSALDLTLLKKQYQIVMQRQRQAQVIITDTFENKFARTFCKSAKAQSQAPPRPPPTPASVLKPMPGTKKVPSPLTSQLLEGKTALLNRKSKRRSLINQALPRAFLNYTNKINPNQPNSSSKNGPFNGLQNPLTSFVTAAFNPRAWGSGFSEKSNNANNAKTGATSNSPNVKIALNGDHYNRVKRDDGQQGMFVYGGGCSVMMVQPQPRGGVTVPVGSMPTTAPPPLISASEARTSSSSSYSSSSRDAFRRSNKSSSSSTSTELCDEVMGLTASDYEDDDEFSDLEYDAPRKTYSRSYENIYYSCGYADTQARTARQMSIKKAFSLQDEQAIFNGAYNNGNAIDQQAGPSMYNGKSLLKEPTEDSDDDNDEVFINRASFSSQESNTLTQDYTLSTDNKQNNNENNENNDQDNKSESKIKKDKENNEHEDDLADDDDEYSDLKRDIDECIRKFKNQLTSIKFEQSIK